MQKIKNRCYNVVGYKFNFCRIITFLKGGNVFE